MTTDWPLYLATEPRPATARPLRQCPLAIVVGLTGVGKSTVVDALDAALLPNRRVLVDRVVLPALGASPDADRVTRFELTRRYRAQHPGGIAHALAECLTDPTWPLVFDGLRGEDEVAFAYRELPQARFIVLEASDMARLGRLLHRNDAFDRVAPDRGDDRDGRDGRDDGRADRLRALAGGVFDDAALDQIRSWDLPEEEVAAKLKVVASERRSYDPRGPRRVLEGSPRACFIDTERTSPTAAAARARGLLASTAAEIGAMP